MVLEVAAAPPLVDPVAVSEFVQDGPEREDE
jgi:hypothetical protein